MDDNFLLNIAFYMYHRAASIAIFKRDQGELNDDEVFELEDILYRVVQTHDSTHLHHVPDGDAE